MKDDILVRNERVKYLSAFFNSIGLAMILLGFLKPLVEGDDTVWIWFGAGVYSCVFAFHLLGLIRKTND